MFLKSVYSSERIEKNFFFALSRKAFQIYENMDFGLLFLVFCIGHKFGLGLLKNNDHFSEYTLSPHKSHIYVWIISLFAQNF